MGGANTRSIFGGVAGSGVAITGGTSRGTGAKDGFSGVGADGLGVRSSDAFGTTNSVTGLSTSVEITGGISNDGGGIGIIGSSAGGAAPVGALAGVSLTDVSVFGAAGAARMPGAGR